MTVEVSKQVVFTPITADDGVRVSVQRAYVPIYGSGMNVAKQVAYVPIYGSGVSVAKQVAYVPIYNGALITAGRRRPQVSIIT